MSMNIQSYQSMVSLSPYMMSLHLYMTSHILIMTLLLTSLVPSCGSVSLTGSGATFPAEVYESWMPAFQYHRSDYVSIDLEYEEVGSVLGKAEFQHAAAGGAMYAGTDAVLADSGRSPDMLLVPVLAGAVVLAYHLPGVPSLVLSRPAVVGIFNGTIRTWDDPVLQYLNPNITLPAADIRVVVRADDCGTTEIFTAALSSFSSTWAEQYGTFTEGVDSDEVPTRWSRSVPALLGRTNRGVAGIIYSYAYSIGYISVGESRVGDIPYAKLINRAGNTVSVGHANATRAIMAECMDKFTNDLTCSLVDSGLQDAYPILGYSYFLIRKDINMTSGSDVNCAAAVELYRYIEWILWDSYSAEIAADKKFAQVIPEVGKLVTSQVLEKLSCSGELVEALVAVQRDNEYWSQQTWTVPVVVIISIAGTLILVLIVYVAYQQAVLRRALAADLWYIPPEDIIVTLDQGKGWPSGVSGVTSTLSEDASYAWPASVVKVGVWSAERVLVRWLPMTTDSNIRCMSTRTKMLVLKWRTKMKHGNLLYCYGLTYYEGAPFIVSEHAQKGVLVDVLQNSRYQLGDEFKFSMATDVTSGLDFLHRQGLVHGGLTSHCCYLDERWNVKIADWELLTLAGDSPKVSRAESDADDVARGRYWTAPELILLDKVSTPTRRSDIFSVSILLVEIFTRQAPYYELQGRVEPQQLIQAVAKAGLRPNILELQPEAVRDVIRQCWDANPTSRPNAAHVTKVLLAKRPSKRTLLEAMMETLEGYVCTLEERVQERTTELAQVHRNLEGLLHQILPPSVASHLAAGRRVTPESYDSVTVFFSDVVGFTSLCANSSPMEVVAFLSDLYSTFDATIDQFDVYKVETIGDAYMVVSGLPERNGISHAVNIAHMAQHFLRAVGAFRIRHKPQVRLRLRAGIHSGPVVAGVVGQKMPRYCVFGDTVNTASRMESTSEPMKVQLSYTTYKLLVEQGGFEFSFRGEETIKGKEKMPTFFLMDTA